MSSKKYAVIVGTGSHIPERRVTNAAFLQHQFHQPDGSKFEKQNVEIIQKLEDITCIKERRYAADHETTSDLAFYAAKDALDSSGIDKESLDYIILAHNFGDVKHDNRRSDFVPCLASRVKYRLGIKNPKTIAYDLPFGCPGWLQGMIQAGYYLKSGDADKALVIGAEVLSRVLDPHDRDSMIFGDGSGATILQAVESEEPVGMLSHAARSDTLNHGKLIRLGQSNNPDYEGGELFVKMNGHKLYQYAVRNVPGVVKESLDRADISLGNVRKILIHQANEKMDQAISRRLFDLYKIKEIPENLMPMTIGWLGNSSVATIPTLLDLLLKGKLDHHQVNPKDIIVFASVGAGMNINSMVYKMP